MLLLDIDVRAVLGDPGQMCGLLRCCFPGFYNSNDHNVATTIDTVRYKNLQRIHLNRF